MFKTNWSENEKVADGHNYNKIKIGVQSQDVCACMHDMHAKSNKEY